MPLTTFSNTFAGNPLDRASERRGDAAWIAASLESAEAQALVLWNGSPLVKSTDRGADGLQLSFLPVRLAKELAAGEERLLFLGCRTDESAVFALDLEGPADPSDGRVEGLGRFDNLRALVPRISGAEAAIAATAKAVFEWRRRHRFCSACGQPTQVAEAGWKRVCPACASEHFPRTDPVVIMLPVQGGRCLLGRQLQWPEGMYSALAGFMEPGETIEEACAREMREEAGLDTLHVRYHSSQPWPFPSSLMIGLIADVGPGEPRPDQTELGEVRAFTREEARALLAGEVDGAFAPPPLAIAHHLLQAWVKATPG